MPIDYMQFRITTGLFTPTEKKKRRKCNSQCISNTTMALFYTISCAILCVSFLATSQPSDHSDIPIVKNTGKYTSIAINTSVNAFILPNGNLTSSYHIVSNTDNMYSIEINADNTAFSIESIHALPRTLISTRLFSSDHTIGNKAAYTYNGNINKQSSKCKPRFPCVACCLEVKGSHKAISCDICESWTHVKCTSIITATQYDRLLSTNEHFSYTCNACSSEAMPFSNAENINLPRDHPTQDQGTEAKNDIDYRVFDAKGLHFISLNVRSLLPKLSEITSLIQRIRPAALQLCETWLDESVTDSEIDIQDYHVVRKDRNRNGGGVLIYIRSDIAFNTRSDLINDSIEAIWVDILLPKTKPILVGSIYRPPNDNNFTEELDETFKKIDTNQETYILGDINICTKNKSSALYKKYMNSLLSYGFSQIIKDPTRVAEKSSILDHIICSSSDKISQSGVIPIGLSDHYLTYCTRKIPKNIFNSHNTVTIRSMKKYSVEEYTNLLENTDWSPVLNSICPESAWSHFRDIFMPILDKVAPFKTIRIKQRTEPWMTPQILEKISVRDGLAQLYKDTKENKHRAEYNKARNEVQRDIKDAKANYITNSLESNLGKPKKLWSQLKLLGYNDKTKGSTNIVLNVGNKLCYDTKAICSYINTFFTTIATNLVSKLPKPSGIYNTNSEKFKSFYRDKNIKPGQFKLKQLSTEKILQELNTLNPQKATGLDNIASRFIKDGASQLAPIVKHIINLSLEKNIVPEELKHAKKNDRLEVSNYRPISVLSCISKVLKKCVHDQIQTYLTNNDLVYEYQSDFRPGYSTETCLIYLTDFIKENVAKGYLVGALLLDVQKAFDCVNHQILCDKINAIGIDPKWFEAYLSGRKQSVSINGISSDPLNITSGVPQGSLLGPLLYLIYSNDMVLSIKHK